ncbi:MAG: hypothetical protein IT556_12235 [Acetobacteraceae bacterium]|nr:hypothetical protein [Acetobacteraceae bacterium]
MKPLHPLSVPPAWWSGAHLAKVVSVQDPNSLSRVQVQLLAPDADNEAPIWARVAVPFAGDNYGAFLIPDVDQEVLVLLVAGDPRAAVVVGALWNGATAIPETIGGSAVDRWTLTGKNGTRIAIVEESSGQEKVEIETPAGVKATLSDESGGKIKLEAAGNTITMDTQGVDIQAGAKVKVSAGQVEVSAGMVKVDAGMSKFSGVVKCDTLIATTVVGSTYTPGAGNIW